MNLGQEKFYQFIMESVNEVDREKAKELLKESFSKQDDGTFNKEYLSEFIPKMLQFVKPDKLDTVKNIMMNYQSK